jgi:hypothetical protein
MSLFIGGLAWEHADFYAPVRLGVITGSVLSAVAGFIVISLGTVAKPSAQPAPVPQTAPTLVEEGGAPETGDQKL